MLIIPFILVLFYICYFCIGLDFRQNFFSYIFVFLKENIKYRIESTNAHFTFYYTSIFRCYFV